MRSEHSAPFVHMAIHIPLTPLYCENYYSCATERWNFALTVTCVGFIKHFMHAIEYIRLYCKEPMLVFIKRL